MKETMFLKNSFPLPQASGFVAFDGGGAVELEDRPSSAAASVLVRQPLTAPASVELPLAVPMVDEASAWQQATWQPTVSSHLRRVEALVIAAICVYFGCGFAGLLGWF